MTKMLLGQLVDDEVFAGWERLSNIDKRHVAIANERALAEQAAAAKTAALPPKPLNWDRLSPSDRRTWFHMQEREQ